MMTRLKPAYAAMTRDSAERCEVALNEVTRRLRVSAFEDPHGTFTRDADGRTVIRPPDEWTEAQRVAVKDVRLRDGRVDAVRFHDPMPALNALVRHVGFYEVDNRQQHNGLADLL